MTAPTPPLSPERRAALRRLATDATDGPWVVHEEPIIANALGRETFEDREFGERERYPVTGWDHPQLDGPQPLVWHASSPYTERPCWRHMRSEDAEYIASLSPDVALMLLDAVDQAEALRARVHDLEAVVREGQRASERGWDAGWAAGRRAALDDAALADAAAREGGGE